jgi:hypothetical protein
VVVAVSSWFGKEQGDVGKLVDVEVVRHRGRRCLAIVSSRQQVKQMVLTLGAGPW